MFFFYQNQEGKVSESEKVHWGGGIFEIIHGHCRCRAQNPRLSMLPICLKTIFNNYFLYVRMFDDKKNKRTDRQETNGSAA
jgi:hypothetical protein